MVRHKKELQTSLKLTSSTKLLLNITSQSNYHRKGLGSVNLTPPYNPYNKYVSVSENLLCLQCGRNVHLKGYFPSWKTSQEKFSIYSIHKKAQQGGPNPTVKSCRQKTTKRRYMLFL